MSHKLFHRPFLYKHVHKIHHQYTQTISLSAIYTHPFEFAFGNMIPVGLPCVLLGSNIHQYTFLLWILMRSINTTSNHSGYDFPCLIPWDILPFRAQASYHDFHHSGDGFAGNFSGMTTIYDTIWGTNIKYFRGQHDRLVKKE